MADEHIYWDLAYDINLPTNGSVKVHGVYWQEETQTLHVRVSTAEEKEPVDLGLYIEGSPVYENDHEGRPVLIGMNPYHLGEPPQSLVKDSHLRHRPR
jgi:hypothetical protein